MSKQYTFKTTKSTAFLEPILDSLPTNRERSEFIRQAIILGLQGNSVLLDTNSGIKRDVTQKSDKKSHNSENVTPKSDKRCDNPKEVTQKCDFQPILEQIEEDIDIDSKLDNLGGKWK